MFKARKLYYCSNVFLVCFINCPTSRREKGAFKLVSRLVWICFVCSCIHSLHLGVIDTMLLWLFMDIVVTVLLFILFVESQFEYQ